MKLFLPLILLTASCFAEIDVIEPENSHQVGNAFQAIGFFPGNRLDYPETNPFVLLDYMPLFSYSPSNECRGVGSHPHKGFETVTLLYKGALSHRDSKGNEGSIAQGEVQWMTAGSGILHEEMLEEAFSKKGGEFQAVQLWVNLPTNKKALPPSYQKLLEKDMPRVKLGEKGAYARVIAGRFQEAKGPAVTQSPVNLYELHLKGCNEVVELAFDPGFNSFLLVIDGVIRVNDKKLAGEGYLVTLSGEDKVSIKAPSESIVLVMSGKPILGPVARSGPFVMTTPEEIDEAWRDFDTGKFGKITPR